MQKKIHPKIKETKVTCITCGNEITIDSTSDEKELKIDVCSNCHPFYTGKSTGFSKAGQIEKFNRKLNKKQG